MRPHEDEPDLARRFADLRADDRRRAPDLDSLLARAAARKLPARAGPALVLVGALLLMVAAAVLFRTRLAPAPAAPGWSAAPLLAWRAPSDGLLATAGRELLAAPPALGRSVLGPAAAPAAGPKAAAEAALIRRKENE